MATVGQYGQREVFKRAYNAIIAAYMAGGASMQEAQASANNAVLTQSYLRLEQPIVAGPTFFNFPVLNNQTSQGNAIRPTEVRLALQDSFFVSSFALYVAVAASTTA